MHPGAQNAPARASYGCFCRFSRRTWAVCSPRRGASESAGSLRPPSVTAFDKRQTLV